MQATLTKRDFSGVKDAEIQSYPLITQDGYTILLTRFLRKPCERVVFLTHGLATSIDTFIIPETYNLVSYLLDNGYTDVWALDWRGSCHLPYNESAHKHKWSLDDVALYDVPLAIQEMRKYIADKPLHVFAHCLGAITFSMSLAANKINNIKSITASSVLLLTKMSQFNKIKLQIAFNFLYYVLRVKSLPTSIKQIPNFSRAKLVSFFASLFKKGCKNKDCHLISYFFGSGDPTLYLHENLLEITHNRVAELVGTVPLYPFLHLKKMIMSGAVVKYKNNDKYATLPDNYLKAVKNINTPILFLSGEKNEIWSDSNTLCYEYMKRECSTDNKLEVIKNYGHQDIVIGKDAHRDVFSSILSFMNLY